MKERLYVCFAAAVFTATAQSPLPLKTSQFFGGANNQTARAMYVSPADGAIYLGGDKGEMVRVPISPAGIKWSVQLQGTSHLGLTTLGSLLYTSGTAMPPACGASDGVGDTEPKGMVSSFAPTTGALVNCRSYNVFAYRGYVSYRAITALNNSLYVAGA